MGTHSSTGVAVKLAVSKPCQDPRKPEIVFEPERDRAIEHGTQARRARFEPHEVGAIHPAQQERPPEEFFHDRDHQGRAGDAQDDQGRIDAAVRP